MHGVSEPDILYLDMHYAVNVTCRLDHWEFDETLRGLEALRFSPEGGSQPPPPFSPLTNANHDQESSSPPFHIWVLPPCAPHGAQGTPPTPPGFASADTLQHSLSPLSPHALQFPPRTPQSPLPPRTPVTPPVPATPATPPVAETPETPAPHEPPATPAPSATSASSRSVPGQRSSSVPAIAVTRAPARLLRSATTSPSLHTKPPRPPASSPPLRTSEQPMLYQATLPLVGGLHLCFPPNSLPVVPSPRRDQGPTSILCGSPAPPWRFGSPAPSMVDSPNSMCSDRTWVVSSTQRVDPSCLLAPPNSEAEETQDVQGNEVSLFLPHSLIPSFPLSPSPSCWVCVCVHACVHLSLSHTHSLTHSHSLSLFLSQVDQHMEDVTPTFIPKLDTPTRTNPDSPQLQNCEHEQVCSPHPPPNSFVFFPLGEPLSPSLPPSHSLCSSLPFSESSVQTLAFCLFLSHTLALSLAHSIRLSFSLSLALFCSLSLLLSLSLSFHLVLVHSLTISFSLPHSGTG